MSPPSLRIEVSLLIELLVVGLHNLTSNRELPNIYAKRRLWGICQQLGWWWEEELPHDYRRLRPLLSEAEQALGSLSDALQDRRDQTVKFLDSLKTMAGIVQAIQSWAANPWLTSDGGVATATPDRLALVANLPTSLIERALATPNLQPPVRKAVLERAAALVAAP